MADGLFTLFSGKTHRVYILADGNPLVEPQQSDIVVKVTEAEIVHDGADDVARLVQFRLVAAVVFAERHTDHEPHESRKENEHFKYQAIL